MEELVEYYSLVFILLYIFNLFKFFGIRKERNDVMLIKCNNNELISLENKSIILNF